MLKIFNKNMVYKKYFLSNKNVIFFSHFLWNNFLKKRSILKKIAFLGLKFSFFLVYCRKYFFIYDYKHQKFLYYCAY